MTPSESGNVGQQGAAPAQQTVEDLGRLVKGKYPGAYDDLSDAALGQRVKAQYPQYGDFADMPGAQPKPQAQQQPKGPNVTPGVSDDDLIRSFGYKPEVIKASPLYQRIVKNTGSGFKDYITEPGSTGQKVLSTPFFGGAAMGLWNVGSALQQFGQHTGMDTTVGLSSKQDTPYLDLLDKVRKENYRQNVLGGQPAPMSATLGEFAGEAAPAIAGTLLSGGLGAGPIVGGMIGGGVQGLATPVNVDPSDPSSYGSQKTGQILGGALTGGALGTVGKVGSKALGISGAGKAIEAITQKIGNAPVNVINPLQEAFDAEAFSKTGGQLPKVVSDFIARLKPGNPPLTFEEARNFYLHATRLSSGEFQNITGPMMARLNDFKNALHVSLTDAAESAQAGLGDAYAKAIKDYSQGMAAKRFATWAGKAAVKSTGTAGKLGLGYELWDYLRRMGRAQGGPILDRYPDRDATLRSLR